MSVPPLLDDLDRALLARLGSDARTPVSALATTLGVARGTVQTRIARLLGGGVVDGSSSSSTPPWTSRRCARSRSSR